MNSQIAGGKLAVLAAALALLSCGPAEDRPGRVYRIGFGRDRPLHYQDANGQPTGMAVAVVAEAARHTGIRLEWVPTVDALGELQANRIDLFVLLAALPERRSIIHLTRPYLSTETAFLVRADSAYRTLQDLQGARVAINDVAVQRLTLRKLLPNSKAVAMGSTAEALQAGQDGRADASFVDQYAGIVGLLDGATAHPLRIIPSGLPARQLAIGASFRNSKVADALREEIAQMSAHQQLAPVLANWSMFPVMMAESAEALNEERRKVQWLAIASAMLGVLFLAVLILLIRLRQRSRLVAEAETRFRSLAETAFEGVMVHDGTRILEASAQLARLFGYDDPQELIAAGDKLIEAKSAELIQQRIKQKLNVSPVELTGIRKDGTHFQVETQGCESIFQGKRVRVVAMRDLSEVRRKEAEHAKLEARLAQAEQLESLGRLAGGVAHDFNNLLTVINGYSGMILRTPGQNKTTRESAEEILKAGQSAADLTAQLLAFSRKQVIQPRLLDLNQVVGAMKGMFARLVPANIEMAYYLPAELPGVVADPGQLHQVLMNLVLNARDAMPNGGKLVVEAAAMTIDSHYVEDHPEAVEGPCVMLAVSDTGMGMSVETRRHIFEPFFTTKPPGAGTGLGLATVYGIVRQNGGWISVYTEPGQGTSFKVYLPQLTDGAAVQKEKVAAPPVSATGTVLVVEDQPQLRKLVVTVLEKAGYKVLEAPTGEDALALTAEFPEIDLLLTDVVLPGMSGMELGRTLAEKRPALQVLYMSGYTENVIVKQGVLKPGIEFLPKPLNFDDLVAKVAEMVRRGA